LKRLNRNDSRENNSLEESFGPYKDRGIDKFRAIGSSVSPTSENRILNTHDNHPPFLSNYSINQNKINKKKPNRKAGSVNKMSKNTANMTESID
jgi:hypothetical protein